MLRHCGHQETDKTVGENISERCQNKPLQMLSNFIFILRAAYLELGCVWGMLFLFISLLHQNCSPCLRDTSTDNTVADSLWAL